MPFIVNVRSGATVRRAVGGMPICLSGSPGVRVDANRRVDPLSGGGGPLLEHDLPGDRRAGPGDDEQVLSTSAPTRQRLLGELAGFVGRAALRPFTGR